MRVLALIPARAGSKGLPGKNIRPLAGKPLVQWMLERAQDISARRGDVKVHLSTDGPEIVAAVPEALRPDRLRPASLAADQSGMLEVVLHELDAFNSDGQQFDVVLLLQPTSPLLAVDDVLGLLDPILRGECESTAAVCENAHPVEWSFTVDQGALNWLLPAADIPKRRQDTKRSFRLVGAFCTRVDVLRRHREFSRPGATRAVVVPAARAVDIDSLADFRDAESSLVHALADAAEKWLAQPGTVVDWTTQSVDALENQVRQLRVGGAASIALKTGLSTERSPGLVRDVALRLGTPVMIDRDATGLWRTWELLPGLIRR